MFAYQMYNIVVTVLTGLGLIASITFFAMALTSIKTNKDPSRKAFAYVKPALGLLVLGSVLHFSTSIMYIWLSGGFGYEGDYSSYQNVSTATPYIYETGELFLHICDCLVIVALVLLDRGISISNIGSSTSRGSSRFVKALIGLAILAGLIYFVTWALAMHIYAATLNSYTRMGVALEETYALCGMRLAYWVIMIVAAVTLLGRAIVSFSKGHDSAGARVATRFFLPAISIFLIRAIFYFILWILNTMRITGSTIFMWPQYFDVLQTVLGYYPLIVTLVLLLFLGRKQRNGLGSDSHYAAPQTAAPKHGPYDSA